MRWCNVLLMSTLAVMAGIAHAEEFDGTTSLLCANIDATECPFGSECLERDAISINIPRFFRINVVDKRLEEVQAEGEGRTTDILNTHMLEDRVIYQGVEGGRAWSLVLSKSSGEITLSAAGSGVAFAVFGACMPR